jgi:hypothetical protein
MWYDDDDVLLLLLSWLLLAVGAVRVCVRAPQVNFFYLTCISFFFPFYAERDSGGRIRTIMAIIDF